ncbi:MAG: hypothetical protein HY038_08775 [Nitrospirae bacterium]|nr:hypothetical protein [Nitrospirota bacterium]
MPNSGGQVGLTVLLRIGSEDAQKLRSSGNGAGAEQIRSQRQDQPALSVGLHQNSVSLAELLTLAERSQVGKQADGGYRASEMVVFRRP